MPTPQPDLNQIAADLAKTATALDRHINTEAQKRANKLTVEYAKTAREQIDTATKQAAAKIQRRDDVITELRLQLDLQVQRAKEGHDAQARLRNVRQCKVWTDDLGRRFVFCDELWHATDPEHNPPPAPVRLDKEN